VLSDGKPINCWDPSVDPHRFCDVATRLRKSILMMRVCCFAVVSLDAVRYPLTIMVKQLVANKDWLFSVEVSELISSQTLHQ